MQSHSHNGSSFYPTDAASDVGSSANGRSGEGAMHVPFIQQHFNRGHGFMPFGHPSPDDWKAPGHGHNVQGQV
jgi:hypothetical protein